MLSICGAYVSDVPVAWMLVDLAVVGPAWLHAPWADLLTLALTPHPGGSASTRFLVSSP